VADDARVELKGFAELAAGTAVLARRIDEAAPGAFAMVAEQAAGGLRSSLPRRTGALASSAGPYRSGEVAGLQMGAGLRYAPFVEYGGRGHPPSSQGAYLYPAAMDSEAALVAAGSAAAQKEIGGMSWPRPM
jgi:hypothetical protein